MLCLLADESPHGPRRHHLGRQHQLWPLTDVKQHDIFQTLCSAKYLGIDKKSTKILDAEEI